LLFGLARAASLPFNLLHQVHAIQNYKHNLYAFEAQNQRWPNMHQDNVYRAAYLSSKKREQAGSTQTGAFAMHFRQDW